MRPSTVPYSLTGSGLTKTADIGGARFGQWSVGAFSPTSYVATTIRTPAQQLSIPPTYANLTGYGLAAANPPATRRTSWLVVGAIVVVLVMFVAKRKGKIR